MSAPLLFEPPLFGREGQLLRGPTAADDAVCRAYLEWLRWPESFVCPWCSGLDAWRTGAGLFVCTACRRRTSVTSGTVLHRSRVPLAVWFAAAWLMTEREEGVSALQLQRELAFGSYETAWALLHRLRRVMALEARPRLDGEVELGATTIAVVEREGRPVDNGSVAVIIAAGRTVHHGLDDVRIAAVPDLSDLQVGDFVARTIAPSAVVRPTMAFVQRRAGEGHRAEGPRAQGHHAEGHRSRPFVATPAADGAPTPFGNGTRVAARLERWLADTLHHGVSAGQLAYYLDEFAFRVNEPCGGAGSRYLRLLDLAVHADPAPFRDLVGGTTDVLAAW